MSNREFASVPHLLVLLAIVVAAITFRRAEIVVAGGLIWTLWHLRKPSYFLYAFYLAFPFAFTDYPKAKIGFVSIELEDLLLILIAVTTAIVYIGRWNNPEGRPGPTRLGRQSRSAIGLMALLVLGLLVSCLAVGEPLIWVVSGVGFLIAYVSAVLLVRSMERFQWVIALLKIAALILAAGTLLSAYGFVDRLGALGDALNMRTGYAVPGLGAVYATSGFVQNRGGYGVNMAFVLPFVLLAVVEGFRGRSRRWFHGTLHLALAGVLLWSIAVTGSRSTWLMAVVVVFVFALGRSVRRLNPVAIVGGVVPIALILFAIGNSLLSRVVSAAYEMREITVDSRMELDTLSLQTFLQHPFFGILHDDIFRIGGLGLYIHNFFLLFAVDTGLVGLVPVLLLFGLTIKMLFEMSVRDKGPVQAYALCMVTAFAGMMVELMFYAGGEKQMWVYLGLICALYGIWKKDKRQRTRDARAATPVAVPTDGWPPDGDPGPGDAQVREGA